MWVSGRFLPCGFGSCQGRSFPWIVASVGSCFSCRGLAAAGLHLRPAPPWGVCPPHSGTVLWGGQAGDPCDPGGPCPGVRTAGQKSLVTARGKEKGDTEAAGFLGPAGPEANVTPPSVLPGSAGVSEGQVVAVALLAGRCRGGAIPDT